MLVSKCSWRGFFVCSLLISCSQGKTYKTSGVSSADSSGGVKLALTLPASPDSTHYSIEATPTGCSYTEPAVVTKAYAASAEGFLYPGCDHTIKVTLGLGGDSTAGGGGGALVTYDADIGPYVSGKCALSGCHDGTTPPKLTTYDEVKLEAETSKNRMALTGAGGMPPGAPPPAEDVDLFAQWIAAGTPQSAAAFALAGASYNSNVKAFFDTNCTAACHKPGSAEGDLTTYELLTANANDLAVKSIAEMEAGSMPVGKAPAPADIELLKTWQTDGFPLDEGGEVDTTTAEDPPPANVKGPKDAPLTTVYYEATGNVPKSDGTSATGPKLQFKATKEGTDKGLAPTLE
ncbi:MAG: hypothetical protein AB7T49_11685 [Oligoflexales bacterium]